MHEDLILDEVVVPSVVRYDRWLALKDRADVALLAVVGLTNGFDDHVDEV